MSKPKTKVIIDNSTFKNEPLDRVVLRLYNKLQTDALIKIMDIKLFYGTREYSKCLPCPHIRLKSGVKLVDIRFPDKKIYRTITFILVDEAANEETAVSISFNNPTEPKYTPMKNTI